MQCEPNRDLCLQSFTSSRLAFSTTTIVRSSSTWPDTITAFQIGVNCGSKPNTDASCSLDQVKHGYCLRQSLQRVLSSVFHLTTLLRSRVSRDRALWTHSLTVPCKLEINLVINITLSREFQESPEFFDRRDADPLRSADDEAGNESVCMDSTTAGLTHHHGKT